MKGYLTLCALLMLSFISFGQPYTDYIGAGHNRNIIVTSSSSQQREDWDELASGDKTLSGVGLEGKLSEAARMLSQATFGYNEKEIEYAASLGIEAWVEEQTTLSSKSYLEQAEEMLKYTNDYFLSQGKDSSELNFNVGDLSWMYAYWQKTVFDKDQLRQRMAFALSQILVISNESLSDGRGLAGYYDMLSSHAFGNYKDLLMDMAINPSMGYYLSHLNNPKAIPEENIHPDQNFAREIMQLFTIGLQQLNTDGSPMLDANGNPIPTYNNTHIAEMAKIFTGLGIGAAMPEMGDLYFGRGIYGSDMKAPMIMYEEWHEPGEKRVFNNNVIPAGQTGMKDIQDAIDALFNHPSCPSFISRQLIQRFVKSNPSPEYIRRVTNVFINDGNGVRGNLKAVIKAILLDDEARNCAFIDDPKGGKLIEPLIRNAQFYRGIGVRPELEGSKYVFNHGLYFGEQVNQNILGAPSVFNFFKPDHKPTGPLSDQNLFAPEFQILNSLSVINYPNQVRYNLRGNATDHWLGDEGPFDTYSKQDRFLRDVYDSEALINRLDLLFTHGNMSDFTRTLIKDAIAPIPPNIDGFKDKVNLAVYLTLISPDYNIQK